MAVKISRDIPLSVGSRAFSFRNQGDRIADQLQYEEGRSHENARFLRGSLAQKMFDRLSSEAIVVVDLKKARKK